MGHVIIIIIIIIITIIIQELQIRRQIYASMNRAPPRKTLLANPSTLHLFFKWVDSLGIYDFFWELIPGLDCSEVENICLESSHAIFGCFPYQLVVVFSTRTVPKFSLKRSEIFR